MLSGPRQLASAEQTFHYFLHEYLARNDSTHRTANRWHGQGAEALGLPQRVGKRKFISILSGHVPGTDIRLGRVVAGEHQHRPGWDLTFSAPKSVSLEALLHGDRRVMRAHDRAVRATLDWVEVEFLQTRGYDPVTGRRPREAADGMIAATFRHVASRNNDPQLHTHAVIANMTRNRDGEWRSVEPTLLNRNRRLIGSWYRNELARELSELGYVLTPTTVGGMPGFELAGYSHAFLDAFSTRRQDILRYMETEGLDYTAENAGQAALATRGKKNEPGRDVLSEMWQRKAQSLGLSRDPGAVRLDRKERKLTRVPPRFSPLEAAWQALYHLEERDCVFRPQDLLAAALGRDPGRHSHTDLQAAIGRLEKDGHLVRTKSGDFTTRRTLRAEKEIIALMCEGRGMSKVLADPVTVARHLDSVPLTDGQREAVGRILLSDDSVIGVQGFAGTGKTRMLNEIVRLAGDRLVFGLAPSSAAARVLATESGIGTTTLQWLLTRYGSLAEGTASAAELKQARDQFAGSIMVVDESSMVGTVQMRALMRIAKALELGRLVLVGDTLQLKSVEAGQPFRLLQRAGMETTRMDDVLRQRSADLKAAVTHMVAGDPDLAVASLGGDVRELPPDALAETAARLWLALPEEARAGTAVLAPTHELREEINATIRHGLGEEGVLRGRSLEILRLVDRRLTRVLAADPASYRPGNVVVTNRDVYGCREGEAWTVTGSSPERVELARKGSDGGFRPSGNASHNVSVFETRPLSLRAGDEIVFTRNLKKRKIINGERATIEEIGRERVRIRLESGRGLSIGVDDDDLRHIDHAWSSTVHRAQGMTKDNVIAVLDASSMMSDRAMLYVEMSRAREGFVLLTDDTEQLVHRLEQEHGRAPSALEATGDESWLVPDPATPVTEKEPLCQALHDWRTLEAAAREAGVPAFHMDGSDALMARIQRRSERDPEMPEVLKRALEYHEPFVRDRERVTRLSGRADLAAGARTRLLAEAQAANTDLRNLDGYARWRRDADRAVAEGRELLGDETRYGLHLAKVGHARDRFDELERACRFDDRAAALLASWQEGGRRFDEAAAFEGSKLSGEARKGEMPPELASALLDFEARWETEFRSERYLAALAALADERKAFVADSETSAAAHPRYAGWRRKFEDVLGRVPEIPVSEFREAVTAGTAEIRSRIGLDEDVARLHDRWQQHAEDAERKGQHPFARDGAEALVSEIARIPEDEIPQPMQRLAVEYERFREDRNRARQLADVAARLAVRRADLLERALEGGLPLSEVPEHDAWTAEAEQVVEDSREALSGSGRISPQIGDEDRETFGTALAELERGLEFDRRAGQLLRDIGGGEADENFADRIRQLEREARPGELPPALVKAFRAHEERQRAEAAREYRVLLEEGMDERERMLAESTEPISGTDKYGKWRQRVETVLAGLEAVEPGAGDSPLATRIRDAVDRDETAAKTWSDWRAHLAAAERAGRHPLSMPGHDRLMDRIEELEPDCPAVLANALIESRQLERSVDRLHVVRKDLRRLARAGAGEETGDDATRLTAGEARTLLSDEFLERAYLAHEPEIRSEMTFACDMIEERLESGDRVRAMIEDWQLLRAEAGKAGLHPFLMPGYGAVMERIRDHRGRLPEELDRAKREHPALLKTNRRAEKLAATICSCRDRRQDLLEKAAESLGPGESFNGIGRKHRSWQRQAKRAIEAGKKLREGPEPPLLHPDRRKEVAASLGRIRKAAALDGLPPRFILDWEAFTDRAKAAGGHRFFVPGYEDLCDRMDKLEADTTAARLFRHGEVETCREMRSRRYALESAEKAGARLRQEREEHGPDFARKAGYDFWRISAQSWLGESRRLLEKNRDHDPFLARDPALKASLEKLRDMLAARLERDEPAWREASEQMQRELEQERALRKARGKDRGFDIGW